VTGLLFFKVAKEKECFLVSALSKHFSFWLMKILGIPEKYSVYVSANQKLTFLFQYLE
jgi:hypothetical protein